MTTLLLMDDAMIEHSPGPGHPERPYRLRAISALISKTSIEGTVVESPPLVTREAVERVHPAVYVDRIDAADGHNVALDPDTHLSEGSVKVARMAAGAGVRAVDAIMAGEVDSAFAMIRPPGHHALPDRAMGFCVYNNVAIAAEHARSVHGLSRILIVDWDVHHGNGTQDIFYGRDDVLFFSTHQFPSFPGTGANRESGTGAGAGFTVNIPFSAGANDADLRRSFTEVLEPVAESFAPELVLVSAGFDAHRRDPLGELELSDEGFADLCASVKSIADEHAKGRLALLLEGGYDLEGLATSVVACTRVLAGETAPDLSGPFTTRGEAALRAAIAPHRERWKL